MTPDDLLIIVQARVGGSRFPGKMLAPLLGQPMILWTLQRIRRLTIPHTLVVAVPEGEANKPLINLCKRHGYTCIASEDANEADVLSRFRTVLDRYPGVEAIVRVTGDCCLLDADVINGCLELFYQRPVSGKQLFYNLRDGVKIEHLPYDHVGIAAEWPDGQDVEIFHRLALEQAIIEATDPVDREHVGPFIWKDPERFACKTYPCPMDLTQYQTSVDTETDLLLAEGVLSWCLDRYGFGFTWRDIWRCLNHEQNLPLMAMMLQRPPRNQSYVAQAGAKTWESIRYGCGKS